MNKKRMDSVKRKCDFFHGIAINANGTREGLSLAWKDDFQFFLGVFLLIFY